MGRGPNRNPRGQNAHLSQRGFLFSKTLWGFQNSSVCFLCKLLEAPTRCLMVDSWALPGWHTGSPHRYFGRPGSNMQKGGACSRDAFMSTVWLDVTRTVSHLLIRTNERSASLGFLLGDDSRPLTTSPRQLKTTQWISKRPLWSSTIVLLKTTLSAWKLT